MLNLIKNILGNSSKPQLTANDTAQEVHVALCVLLLEAAHVDGECSDAELEHIVLTLSKETGIPRQEIDDLIALGRRERNDSIDLFRFTRYMNTTYTKDEKIKVMEAVWRIIHIDSHLEAHEDQFAHKLANLLRLSHADLIDAKLKAKKQLS